jgi:16S rRNA (cytosine967-C5)-methyltransferase
MAVERGQSHSDDLLRGKAVNSLSAPDRNLATALVLGVLRWQIRLDHQLHSLLKHPNARLDPEVLIALRLGAFQILHLDRIPARAAIDESVELAKQAGHRFASGMVNAVLRKLAASSQAAEELNATVSLESAGQESVSQGSVGQGFSPDTKPAESTGVFQIPEKRTGLKGTGFSPYINLAKSPGALAPEGSLPEESPAELALAQAHPAWMVERWAAFYGIEAARALCSHDQSQPSLTLRIHDPAVADELAAAGILLQPGELLTVARTVVSGDVTASAAFNEGRLRLQDEGSQLIAELAGPARANPARSIMDCCAAPGNKTLILAQRNLKARILACESSPQRFEQLRQRLGVLGDRIECRLIDATTLPESSVFDLALADVPCSGTGTLGRNPEIRHRLRPEDLARQAERQRSILLAALRAVRPGGRVVYSTCSLEPEENEQVVAAALAETPNAGQISLEPRIEALLGQAILTPSGANRLRRCLTPEGALRLLPGAFHTDGFFIALIERTA